MVKIIAAMGLDRSMGLKGKRPLLPWQNLPVARGDLVRFKKMTQNQVVIMGRRTWDSLGRKPLPNRFNYVVATKMVNCASQDNAPYCIAQSLDNALETAQKEHPGKNVFLIGGERVFRDGQKFAEEIDLTVLPYKGYDFYSTDSLIYFPEVDTKIFKKRSSFTHPNNPSLRIIRYRRS